MSASETLYTALLGYIASNGRRLLALARTLGQEEVAIELRALFRYHDPSLGFDKLEQAANQILSTPEETKALESKGLRLETRNDTLYVVISVKQIEKLLNELAR